MAHIWDNAKSENDEHIDFTIARRGGRFPINELEKSSRRAMTVARIMLKPLFYFTFAILV